VKSERLYEERKEDIYKRKVGTDVICIEGFSSDQRSAGIKDLKLVKIENSYKRKPQDNSRKNNNVQDSSYKDSLIWVYISEQICVILFAHILWPDESHLQNLRSFQLRVSDSPAHFLSKQSEAMLRACAKITSHFRIPSSAHLCLRLNRKILEIVLLFLWICSIGAAKFDLNLDANSVRLFFRKPLDGIKNLSCFWVADRLNTSFFHGKQS
jgi:hypothetical protein